MRDWHAALGPGLLVLRVEDLLDSPVQSASMRQSALFVAAQLTTLASWANSPGSWWQSSLGVSRCAAPARP